MDELHYRRQVVMMLACVAKSLRRQQHQRRTQPFAAAVDDVFTDLIDQRHFGMQACADHRIHRRHIRREQLL